MTELLQGNFIALDTDSHHIPIHHTVIGVNGELTMHSWEKGSHLIVRHAQPVEAFCSKEPVLIHEIEGRVAQGNVLVKATIRYSLPNSPSALIEVRSSSIAFTVNPGDIVEVS